MKTNIPAARLAIADCLADIEANIQMIRELIEGPMMTRHPTKPMVQDKTLNVCDAVTAGHIRDFAEANPETTLLEIGRVFNVNPGRVSEALNNLR